MMIRKAVVLSFSLLILPSLSHAQCVNETSAQCSEAKTVDVKQGDKNTITNTGESSTGNEAVSANARQSFSPRNNKRRTERQFPRFEAADPRDTVLSSEICVYSSATYTYTCR